MAQVTAIEQSVPYQVARKNGDPRRLSVQLRIKRGTSERLAKVTSISNQDITMDEYRTWWNLTTKMMGEVETYYQTEFERKAEDILEARRYVWTDTAVSQKLARKVDAHGNRMSLEFECQKDQRCRAMVQTTLSQLDISGIRETEAQVLESTYKEALVQLHIQEKKAVEVQDDWFKMRPNLYSLKMINEKNLKKQYADDKHALEYTLENEASGQGGLNPFQRRACRPVCAWDTTLTAVELGKAEGEPSASSTSQAAPAAAAAPAAPAGLNGTVSRGDAGGEAGVSSSDQPTARMDSILQAHRRA